MLISGSPRGISALHWFLRKFHGVMEAQLNLNIDLLQKSTEELMISFTVDLDRYLKLDVFTSHGLVVWKKNHGLKDVRFLPNFRKVLKKQ